jgi:hypothetical protein
MGDWVEPRDILDAVEKRKTSYHCRDSNLDSSVVQLIA